ncbi:MAG: DoxX family protein [Armatimonadota bacterium]
MNSVVDIKRDRSAVDFALLVVRIFVGIVFIAHGSQKMFGAFGGHGLAGTVQFMGPIGYLVTVGEFFGGLGVLLGFLSRFSSAAQIVIMLGAIFTVHLKNGFFAPSGFEFPFSLIGPLACILIAGPGRYAIGRYLPLPKDSSGERPIAYLE